LRHSSSFSVSAYAETVAALVGDRASALKSWPTTHTLFCDETGNSGSNYYYPDQPIYAEGGWLVAHGQTEKLENAVLEIERSHRFTPKTKGTKLKDSTRGQEYLDAVSRKATPFFYLVEKKYWICARAVGTFFDPNYNLTVAPIETFDPRINKVRADLLYAVPDNRRIGFRTAIGMRVPTNSRLFIGYFLFRSTQFSRSYCFRIISRSESFRIRARPTSGMGKNVDNSNILGNWLRVIFTPEGRSDQWRFNPFMKEQVTLVTGASRGIGKAISQKLVQAGYRVFGTTRGSSSAGTVDKLLRLDVQDENSVEECVNAILDEAGRIDLLINNAGITIYGAIEELSLGQVKELFETNFFGVVRLTQAVLPTMRRQASGRIINIGSVAGFLPMPYQAAYAASKHALAGWTETLDLEIRRFGIRAILIQPGFISTDIDRNSTAGALRTDIYADERNRVIERLRVNIERGDDPATVADAVLQAATKREPATKMLVGQGSRQLRILRTLLPRTIFELGLRRQFGLGVPPKQINRGTK
jgi:NAD(P)-dependent dehydrogenase (short-subunit alcohol dehydrogenase family)